MQWSCSDLACTEMLVAEGEWCTHHSGVIPVPKAARVL